MKKKPNLNALTKLEKERELKKIEGELDEELAATGQESDVGAVKWVKEKNKERQKEEQESLAESEWKASDKKGKVFGYRDVIVDEMKRQMVESFDQLPQDFLWYPVKDKGQGIQLWIRDSKGKWYARGMRPCMNPTMDIQCVSRLIQKALDHMDDLERKYKEPEGIVI